MISRCLLWHGWPAARPGLTSRVLHSRAHAHPRLSARLPPTARSKVVLSVGHYAHQVPLQATLGAPEAAVDPVMYAPPPLRPHAVGWQPEWGKVWQWYGIGRESW